jgi:uracil-DNA glycosylase family 4
VLVIWPELAVMGIALHLSTLAVRQVVGGACQAVGVPLGEQAVEGVVGFLSSRFVDHSQHLTEALSGANDRAWRALEIALAGDSLWERCKVLLSAGEEKGFRERVRAFLTVTPQAELFGQKQYCQLCLRDLQAARKAGALTHGHLDPHHLARAAGNFARFSDPQRLLIAESEALEQLASDLRQAGYVNLSGLVIMRPDRGPPLLVVAVRYFFRRAVEENAALFQGLAFAQLEGLQQSQEQGFAGLHEALTEQSARLEQLLADLQTTVAQTHTAVLDIQEEQRRQGDQNRDIYNAVIAVQGRLDLLQREVRPRDSLSIRSDGERDLVKQLVSRYRALPEERRRDMPALLNAIGKLEVAAGDFQTAQKDFAAVAGLVQDAPAKAEAHVNAYRAALERRDWGTALKELVQAVEWDAAHVAPFPLDKYQPLRILGAGGFGVAFLCKHRYMNAEVVVKTLAGDDLDRSIEQVFAEAQVLTQLHHPSIIRISDCGYAHPATRTGPYLVMDYFDGQTLEEHAREKPLSVADLLAVARPIAEGLQAAHAKGILHRDVKPANVLVRHDDAGWHVKLIDFGLALRKSTLQNTAASAKTIQGSSIAGTLDYAAPEQMGKRDGAIGPASDVYGFAKTCCYALFQTPQPLLRHWRSVPAELAEVLENCMEETPQSRPADFKSVLDRLAALLPAPIAPPKPPLPKLPVVEAAAEREPARRPADGMSLEERQRELAALAQRISGCERCTSLVRSRTQTVFGVGPLDAAVCFLGEAPGADEDRQGEPFIGAAGQLFNRILAASGLKREEMYIANMLKCRPPGNRTPAANEVSNCRDFLEQQLALVRPKVIVALGGCAAQNLLNTTQSLGKLRGRFHDYHGTPVLCTYHPAFLLPHRSPEKKADVWEDMKLLLQRLNRPIPQTGGRVPTM